MRGLDYYTGVVFECFGEGLLGRTRFWRGLSPCPPFGGEDTPSAGFAIGFDWVMVAVGEETDTLAAGVIIVNTGEGRDHALFVAGSSGQRDNHHDRPDGQEPAQMKAAGKSALCSHNGKDEVKAGTVTLKDMKTGTQRCSRS